MHSWNPRTPSPHVHSSHPELRWQRRWRPLWSVWNQRQPGGNVGSLEMKWSFTSLLKHFIMIECYRAVVIQGGDCGCFGHWHYCSSLKTWWYCSLLQRSVEDDQWKPQLVGQHIPSAPFLTQVMAKLFDLQALMDSKIWQKVQVKDKWMQCSCELIQMTCKSHFMKAFDL